MGEQSQNLSRVKDVIGGAILEFRNQIGLRMPFRCEELRDFVIEKHPHIAPASPDRILRALRKDGVLGYQVLSRPGSLYEFTA